MKSLKTASILILAVFSLSMVSGAFAADNCAAPTKKEKFLWETGVNSIFEVKLPCNPTTGYKWFPKFDSNSLELVNETYVPYMPIRCGSGGCQIFTFKSLKYGETDITMDYVRPWENCRPAKEIIYHVYTMKNNEDVWIPEYNIEGSFGI